MSNMLQQAIIDAKALKEAAKDPLGTGIEGGINTAIRATRRKKNN